jgi:hypothetical protein
MQRIAKPIRIEPAFDDREQVRSLIDRSAPYRAIAAYVPDGGCVLPWFRGDWALGGRPLVEGADTILHNPRFIEAARLAFGTSSIHPETVVVNVNAPMPEGAPHVDIPSFRGATRETVPVRLLMAMGASGLFERWRVIEAGAIAWFYDGPGGAFEYWPQGLGGPVRSERPPFGDVAIVMDSDRMYHRIGRIGEPTTELPTMTAASEIRPIGNERWAIVDDGTVRATYPTRAMRFSILWKAEVMEQGSGGDQLSLDRIVEAVAADLHRRQIAFSPPTDPLRDDAWIALLLRTYHDTEAAVRR